MLQATQRDPGVCVCVCVCVRVCVRAYVCACKCMCAHIDVNFLNITCLFLFFCACVCAQVCVLAFSLVYMCDCVWLILRIACPVRYCSLILCTSLLRALCLSFECVPILSMCVNACSCMCSVACLILFAHEHMHAPLVIR